MTFLLASGWTTLLYFGFFVRSKYRTVKPPYERFVLFAMAGMLSTIPAAYFNARVLNDTALNFFETPDIRMGVLGVFLAPGLGEEFWKMAAGLLVVSCLNRRSRPVQPAECVLGFAVVGMAFAVIENIWSYGDGGAAYLLLRGLIAVPLHTSMCMLHGVGVLLYWKRRRAWPLYVFYLTTALLHGLWDVASIYGSSVREIWLPLSVIAVYTLAISVWCAVPERQAQPQGLSA
ncbi:MAG TPA: hypothetical protein DCR55_04145 [Lentisphaeria bacterium]|nr:hypothetical protein [Lentisphaeria bacterium]